MAATSLGFSDESILPVGTPNMSKTGRSAEVIGRSAIADLAVGYRRDPQASMVAGDLRTRALLEALSSNVHGVGPDRGAREPRWEAERQFTRESQSTIRADHIHNRVRVPESSKSSNPLMNPILKNQFPGLNGSLRSPYAQVVPACSLRSHTASTTLATASSARSFTTQCVQLDSHQCNWMLTLPRRC